MTPIEKRALTMADRAARAATPPPTVEGLRETLDGINRRCEIIAKRVGDIIAERRLLSLASHNGDADATAQIGALNAESGSLVGEMSLLGEAEGEAKRLLVLAEAAETAVVDQQREVERKEAIRAQTPLAETISTLAIQLGQAITAFKVAGRGLYGHDEALAAQLLRRLPQALQVAFAEAGVLQAAGLSSSTTNAGKMTFAEAMAPMLTGAMQRPPQSAKPRAQVPVEHLHIQPEAPDQGDALKRMFQEAMAEAPKPEAKPAEAAQDGWKDDVFVATATPDDRAWRRTGGLS